MDNRIIREIAERWKVEALGSSEPKVTETLRACADLLDMMCNISTSNPHSVALQQEFEEWFSKEYPSYGYNGEDGQMKQHMMIGWIAGRIA
jgi:hypothetical protein